MSEEALKLEWVPPTRLRPASWNPKVRTKERNLRTLVQSIKEHGFWPWEPIQLAKDEETEEWVIADGNRRYTAALIAGIDEVPTIKIRDMSAQEYWAQKNGTVRGISIKETSEAIALGLNHVPPSHERSIGDLLSLYNNDWDEIRKLCEHGVNASVSGYARRIANYCGMRGNDEFIVRTIKWIVEHRMTMVASRALSDGVPPELIFEKITENQPLRTGYT